MEGGSRRTIELTGLGEGGERTFFVEFFCVRSGLCGKTQGQAPPRLAKRHCRLHGGTISTKSQNPKKSTKVHPKWYQRRSLDALKTHIEGALADGFTTLWPCAPKRRNNVPSYLRSVQAKCCGYQKRQTSNKKCTTIHKNDPDTPKIMTNAPAWGLYSLRSIHMNSFLSSWKTTYFVRKTGCCFCFTCC